MNQINGLLMSGDLPVAIIKENQLKYFAATAFLIIFAEMAIC